MLELNKLHNINIDNINFYNEDIPSHSIDLTLFSPPYDNIRDYKDKPSFDRTYLGKLLYNITKDGGICVVNIQDGTQDFAKSLTSFRWAVEWVDLGWKLFECCIYSKHGRPGAWWNKRFRVDHEYLMIFFKGDRPRYFDKTHLMIPAKCAGEKWHGTQRLTDGSLIKIKPKIQKDVKCRGTIWHYGASTTELNKIKLKHPATMPDKLAEDIIQCFSKEGDVVFDPFAGSGTTLFAANKLKRNFLGCEIAQEYCDIFNERMKNGV